MGWEDCDLCTRAWLRGWPSLYEPQSVIYHKSSASISRAYRRGERDTLGFRNAFLWFLANFSSPARLLRFFALLPLTLLLFLLTGRKSQWRGFWRSLPLMARALRRRAEDRAHDVMDGAVLLEKFRGLR
jgi:GT2 family glycosyltransferase